MLCSELVPGQGGLRLRWKIPTPPSGQGCGDGTPFRHAPQRMPGEHRGCSARPGGLSAAFWPPLQPGKVRAGVQPLWAGTPSPALPHRSLLSPPPRQATATPRPQAFTLTVCLSQRPRAIAHLLQFALPPAPALFPTPRFLLLLTILGFLPDQTCYDRSSVGPPICCPTLALNP